MTDLRIIIERINVLRENINNLIVKKSYLSDPEVILASEELDELINLYMKQMNTKINQKI